ncbi:ribosome hibernation-promoting factor, HPF/YfiA family [Amorphus orientalis]|uniref:Ribosome hibernation promoting factor n=1 Tax=Amorphus orientalis TaxID=649198 RepID=A0AAE3VN70_9HYPH|nr:ribosome-associated translation inhibitor RaiA [Amorphus orientalis]MDQ0315158.1 ribosomal subunit interface protein [Amorphus orientalis]
MLKISGKNMDIGNALRERIQDRVDDAVRKYFDGGYSGQIVVEPEGSGFKTDCSVHLDTGVVLKTSATASDATASFDQAAERVEKRLRRYKRRLKSHHTPANGEALEASSFVLAKPDEEDEVPVDYSPVVVAETATHVRTMTVGMAVLDLDLTEAPVVVFRSAANGAINVVYRRSDGNIGWIDPAFDSPKQS